MAYRRSGPARRRRKGLKATVKSVVRSLAESHTSYHDQKQEPTHADIASKISCVPFDMLDTLSVGTRGIDRIGHEIQLRGFRVSITYDNSDIAATAPAYITTLVVSTNENEATADGFIGKLFRGYDTTSEYATGPLISSPGPEWLADVHTTPINTSTYKVLHRSSIRLGCKAEPDMPGPRYAQRVIYVPVNRKIIFPKTGMTTADIRNVKPRIVMMHFITNPTQVPSSGSAKIKLRSEVVGYFKDL
jgi:hypothetical protein